MLTKDLGEAAVLRADGSRGAAEGPGWQVRRHNNDQCDYYY